MFGNWGFGDPEYLADGFYQSTGFGFVEVPSWDPSTEPCVYGFLHPDMGFLDPQILLGPTRYPDNGGVVCAISGPWTSLTAGSFVIRIRDELGTLLPSSSRGCAAPEPPLAGPGDVLVPGPYDNQLQFCLPSAPPGVYDILVYNAASGALLFTYQSVLVVVRRSRVPESWRMRNGAFPEFFAVGPRSAIMETLLGGLAAPE